MDNIYIANRRLSLTHSGRGRSTLLIVFRTLNVDYGTCMPALMDTNAHTQIRKKVAEKVNKLWDK